LIDLGATESFIFGEALKIFKVKEVEQDEFNFVEMVAGEKKRLEGRLRAIALTWESFSAGPTCTSLS
jgi:hypothetical protein